MELGPSNEASPRDLHGIIPLQEAPPRGHPWNYALALRHHQGLPLRGSMELRPTYEAPPRSLTTRVMELCPTHPLNMFHPPVKNPS